MSKEKIPTLEDWKKHIYDDFMSVAYVRNRLTEEEAKKYLFEDGYFRFRINYKRQGLPDHLHGIFRI